MLKCGVYLIVSPTGGRYVGSSNNIFKRWNRYKNLSCHRQHALLSSLKKHGPDKHIFSILLLCDKADLLFWERVFGDIYLSLADFKQGLNIRLPAYDDRPASLSEAFRQVVSNNGKKRFSNPEERLRNGQKTKAALSSPQVREMLSNLHKSRFVDNPSLRIERSQARKRFYQNHPEARKIASDKTKQFYLENPREKENAINALKSYYDKNPTIRQERSISRYKNNPQTGAHHSKKLIQYYIDHPEARLAASERTKHQLSDRWSNVRSKKVINIETQEIYPCSKSVSEMLGIPNNTFRNWLTGKSPNHTPYRYLNLVSHGRN